LVAADRELAPLPPDAPPDCRQTGYWHFSSGGRSLPASVEAFLDKGSRPLFIGFGSMGDPAPQRTASLLREAVRRSGRRAIIQSGWAGYNFDSDDTCLCLSRPIPHDRLFPRVAAAVHHGGAGTVMAAARAGIPQAVVPHLLDQYYWGQRVRKIGLGPEPLDRNRLSVDRLAPILERVAGSVAMRSRARGLALPLQARRGVQDAADWILNAARGSMG
jgi:UDP:flavonoid glycosyltransferase YjiC (YdhE family)